MEALTRGLGEGRGVSNDTGAVQRDPSITVDVRFYPPCRIGNGVPNIPIPVSGWRERKKKKQDKGVVVASNFFFFLFLNAAPHRRVSTRQVVQPTSAMTEPLPPPELPLPACSADDTSTTSEVQRWWGGRRAVTPLE